MRNREQSVFGINPVLEKLRASPGDVVEIIMAAPAGYSGLTAVEAEAKRLGLSVTYSGRALLDRLAGNSKHQGVVARVRRYVYAEVSGLLQRLSALSEREWFWLLILDGLTDPQNFGALLRTAEAVGVRHVVIPKDRSVGITPAVTKAS
jgi:23S rRNA (guanosine2251-2'-O)-methyltransferase